MLHKKFNGLEKLWFRLANCNKRHNHKETTWTTFDKPHIRSSDQSGHISSGLMPQVIAVSQYADDFNVLTLMMKAEAAHSPTQQVNPVTHHKKASCHHQ